jgi:hypothetical protein
MTTLKIKKIKKCNGRRPRKNGKWPPKKNAIEDVLEKMENDHQKKMQ